MKYYHVKEAIPTLLLLGAMFFVGRAIAGAVNETKETSAVVVQSENWGLGFGAEGAKPTGNASIQEMKQYDAYYMSESDEKILYLTFDCGYEKGNTEAILDALKKHNAPAAFFVVGHYLESAPDLVKRMVEEGHVVGNHTYHHPDMSKISDPAAFQKEMDDVKALYKDITGQEMAMYYRPPQGKYSTANLKMAKELGYSTFFWSLAYVDWNVDSLDWSKSSADAIFNQVVADLKHSNYPNEVVLLFHEKKLTLEVLPRVIEYYRNQGYVFMPYYEGEEFDCMKK